MTNGQQKHLLTPYSPVECMEKGFSRILAIVIIIVFFLAGLIYFINTGQQRAESKLLKENPIFHTIPEGGACRDGKGDCQGGLTCTDKICTKS